MEFVRIKLVIHEFEKVQKQLFIQPFGFFGMGNTCNYVFILLPWQLCFCHSNAFRCHSDSFKTLYYCCHFRRQWSHFSHCSKTHQPFKGSYYHSLLSSSVKPANANFHGLKWKCSGLTLTATHSWQAAIKQM